MTEHEITACALLLYGVSDDDAGVRDVDTAWVSDDDTGVALLLACVCEEDICVADDEAGVTLLLIGV